MGRQSWTRGHGPLVPFVGGFRDRLLGVGHPLVSLKHHIVVMGQLNRWLVTRGLGVEMLKPGVAQQFLDERRADGHRRVPTLATLATLAPLFDHLREQDDAYMLQASADLVVGSAKREAADLRALLRYLYLAGELDLDLGAAMPPVASWRGGALVPTMSATDVDQLLASCDRSTASGRRDLAVLVLLARLGLRAGEVAAVELGDVDWRAGEIVVRGKARRKDRLPLPVEVGEALVDYLRDGRPSCECRQLVLTLYAPFRPIRPSSITSLVYRACRRAGLARVGGHRLRHALATEMLRRGGDLIEIAQVLRQSDLGTTAGYAKVDRVALRTVAQRWPGSAA